MNVFEYIMYLYLAIKFFAMVYEDLNQDTVKDAVIGFIGSIVIIAIYFAVVYCASNKILMI